jgi:hypothetical protein
MLATVLLFLPFVAVQAHHSFFGRFDTTTTIELEGMVTEVLWRNPHAHFTLEVVQDGEVIEWDLESGSPTLMTRAGVPPNAVKVGQRIRVAANPPVTDKLEAFATNVLLPSGEELVLQTGATPKFRDQVTGDFSYRFRTAGDRSRPELGLFRIWTFSGAAGPTSFLFPESINRNYDLENYPLTDAARAAIAAFDPATDNPTNDCTPKGMPLIMEQPLPLQIVDRGDSIELVIEEYDLTRVIHMNRSQAPAETERTPLGYSTGHWEGETLVVRTTHVSWPHFDQAGIPQSEQSILTERFTAVEDGSELEYVLIVDDPVNFTAPVTLTKTLLYVPEVEMLPFDCTVVE